MIFLFLVGDEMLHACTGIFIKTSNANTLSILTSYTLVAYDARLDYFKYVRHDFSRVGAAALAVLPPCLAFYYY